MPQGGTASLDGSEFWKVDGYIKMDLDSAIYGDNHTDIGVIDLSTGQVIMSYKWNNFWEKNASNKRFKDIGPENRYKKYAFIPYAEKLDFNYDDGNGTIFNRLVITVKAGEEANIDLSNLQFFIRNRLSNGSPGATLLTSTYSPTPTCFPKGTPVSTDQGVIAIENLNSDQHTIRGKKIVAITQTRPLQKHIVCFEKDSIGKNVPSQQTLCSKEHKVLYQGEMIKARDLADMCKNVKKVSYNGETLYNVLLEKHGKMLVNNLICETLHPENIAAKIATMKNSPEKIKAIREVTKAIRENDASGYKKLSASLK